MKRLLTICLIVTLTSLSSYAVRATDHPNAAEQEKSEGKTAKSIPFHGKIEALDKSAKSLKVGERTFLITSSTKLTKAGKPVTLDDANVGDEVGGAYREGTTGKLELVSLRIGPKPAKK